MRSKVLPDPSTRWVPRPEDAHLDDVAADGEHVDHVPDAGAGDGEGGGDDRPRVAAGRLLRWESQLCDPPHLRPLQVYLQLGGVAANGRSHLAPIQSQPLDRLVS